MVCHVFRRNLCRTDRSSDMAASGSGGGRIVEILVLTRAAIPPVPVK